MKTSRKRLVLIIFLLAIHFKLTAQDLSLSTNLLGYVNFMTLNLQLEIPLNSKISIYTSAKYNPFTYNENKPNQFQNRNTYINTGFKYWLWHTYSGWFTGASAEYGIFNIGGIKSKETQEGWRIGINLFGGYSLMLSKKINLEFGAGIFTGYKKATKFKCPNCGTIKGKEKKIMVAPNNILTQLVYLF